MNFTNQCNKIGVFFAENVTFVKENNRIISLLNHIVGVS